MSFEDHYNWPAANRSDTMYLGTIKPNERGSIKRTFYRERSPNLDISDIEKAKPYYQGYEYKNKEIFVNRTDDIPGGQVKKLHQPLQKVYYEMRTDDIKGAKPQCKKFVTTRLDTNPLNPEYKLPLVEVRVATPPRFIRDGMAIDDIEGARPNPYTKYNIQRKTNDVKDIYGAQPKKDWLPQGKQSSLDVKDINSFDEFHTKRLTDPLSPRYKIPNENNEFFEYGKIDNKVIAKHPKEVKKPTSNDLNTADIEGAKAGTTYQHINSLATRDTFLKTKDIPGALVGSLRKGMESKRNLDPLWPVYVVPGHSEPAPIYTRNLNGTFTKQNALARSLSHSAVKRELPSPAEDSIKSQADIKASNLANDNQIDKTIVRKVSNDKTPPANKEKRTSNSKIKTAEEILGGTKNNNTSEERTEYAALRVAAKENTENPKQKTSPPEVNSEAKVDFMNQKIIFEKKAPTEAYQKNVKGFYGLANLDEQKSTKSLSTAEKFDKYISK